MEVYLLSGELIEQYLNKLSLDESSSATLRKYRHDLDKFFSWSGCELTKNTVIAYKEHLLHEGYGIRSVNSMLAAVNGLFSFLGWHELKVRVMKVQRQIFCAEEKELTRGEYIRLCKSAEQQGKERLSLILQTICGTGIRVSELSFITVEAVHCGTAVVSLKGKTRSVFLVRELKNKLLRYIEHSGVRTGAVFQARTGKPLSRTTIWREMKSLCSAAKVDPKKVFPHNLRHLFAQIFYAIEKDIAKLADLLGHSSIDTTRIYILSSGQEHRRKLEKMHLIL